MLQVEEAEVEFNASIWGSVADHLSRLASRIYSHQRVYTSSLVQSRLGQILPSLSRRVPKNSPSVKNGRPRDRSRTQSTKVFTMLAVDDNRNSADILVASNGAAVMTNRAPRNLTSLLSVYMSSGRT